MSTTLLPFLYQTRTIQRLSRTGVSTPAFRALLHSTTRTDSPRDRPRAHGDPLQAKPRYGDEIPFELPEGYEKPGQQKESPWEVDPETGMRSTITPQERDVFNRIFEEIAERNAARSLEPSAPLPSEQLEPAAATPKELSPASPPRNLNASGMDDFAVRTKEPDSESIRNPINIIVQDAAEEYTNTHRHIKKPFGALHPLDQTASATEWEKALLRFPPSLRHAARMALSTIEDHRSAQKFSAPADAASSAALSEPEMTVEQRSAAAQIDLALDPLAKSVQNEVIRRKERTRVEALMRSAKTDVELWQVLEDEVFPMVRKLGIDEDTTSTSSKGGKRKKRSGDKKFPMHIYGPLYPAYLLTAMRLFDIQFARSSPLALHILPRVKELGPASYVLGVSTPFYNELARILWNRYGDPTAVFNLLEEMRVAGLYCDEGTRSVVSSIEHFFYSVKMGKWGPFLRELSTLPEYEYAVLPRVKHWQHVIQTHLVERRDDLQV
ncbi:hypothetical protein VTI74DRAFT_3938 [Chaetomium olivicolor]